MTGSQTTPLTTEPAHPPGRGNGFALITLIVSAGLATGVAAAIAPAGETAGIPVIWQVMALAFLIQWLAFIPAWWFRTEHYYDLTGTLTYISVVIAALLLSGNTSPRALLVVLMVTVWSARLGWFLFKRIRHDGRDQRFDGVRESLPRFLAAWTLQGLWVALTLPAALVVITTQARDAAPGWADFAGIILWCSGFAIEVVADAQKRAFRRDPANKGAFIADGLWSWSRHPNYFGEIMLWTGVALLATPYLHGSLWLAWISPLFVLLLLTRISGIPLLEETAEERWGGRPEWKAYKATTPVLWPRPPRTAPAPRKGTS